MRRITGKLIFLFLISSAVLPLYGYKLCYAEQYYELYHRHLYEYDENIKYNIYILEHALNAPFANQLNALATIKNLNENDWYQNLFRMQVNLLIIDQYRKNNICLVDNNVRTLDSVTSSTVVSPEKNLQRQTQYEILLDAIAQLPAEQKEAFLLREEAGLSVEQIADTCGINFETAKSRLRYAIKKFRKKLGESA